MGQPASRPLQRPCIHIRLQHDDSRFIAFVVHFITAVSATIAFTKITGTIGSGLSTRTSNLSLFSECEHYPAVSATLISSVLIVCLNFFVGNGAKVTTKIVRTLHSNDEIAFVSSGNEYTDVEFISTHRQLDFNLFSFTGDPNFSHPKKIALLAIFFLTHLMVTVMSCDTHPEKYPNYLSILRCFVILTASPAIVMVNERFPTLRRSFLEKLNGIQPKKQLGNLLKWIWNNPIAATPATADIRAIETRKANSQMKPRNK